MRPFHYECVSTKNDALHRMNARLDGADEATIDTPQYLGGGTDLIELVKLDVRHPTALVDVHDADDLRTITPTDGGGWRIGAAVRMHELAEHAGVAETHPLIRQSLRMGATPQVRHLATIAGNLLQRTRCAYFRMAVEDCNRRHPGGGCAAIAGEKSSHAILGTSDSCIAVHPSDFAVAAVAADARVRCVVPSGARRDLPVAELYRLPGDHPIAETHLHPGELIESIELPTHPGTPGDTGGSSYAKIPPAGFAAASAAVVVDATDPGRPRFQVALGGVATVPWRAGRAEAVLNEMSPGRPAARRAAAAELAGVDDSGGHEAKRPLVAAVLVEAVKEACRRANLGFDDDGDDGPSARP